MRDAEGVGPCHFVTELGKFVVVPKVIDDARRTLAGKERCVVTSAHVALFAEPVLVVAVCRELRRWLCLRVHRALVRLTISYGGQWFSIVTNLLPSYRENALRCLWQVPFMGEAWLVRDRLGRRPGRRDVPEMIARIES